MAAFESNGFGHLQDGLSDRVREELRMEGNCVIATDRPTLDQVSLCFPKRYALTHAIAFGSVMGEGCARPLLLRGKRLRIQPDTAASVQAARSPVFGRTRAETRALRSHDRCALNFPLSEHFTSVSMFFVRGQ